MSEKKLPRDCVELEAINPYDGKIWNLLLRDSKRAWAAKRGMGATKELAFSVPWTVMNPTAIFRGVREEGESQWLCYISSPEDAFSYRTGERIRPRLGEVFLVFVDDERFIYAWRWEQGDPDDLCLPRNHGTRFQERLL